MKLFHRFSFLLVLATLFMVGCNVVDFTGRTPKESVEPAAPAISTPTPPAPVPAPPPAPAAPTPPVPPSAEPPSSIPIECQNALEAPGIKDPASGLTFRLLPEQKSYDEGVKSCAALAAGGVMIYLNQELPDAILACQKVLGTLWMRRNAAGLWQPDLQGERGPEEQHWIICYF